MKELSNICVCRIDRMGDLIITTPALKVIRTIWPGSRITLLVSNINSKVLEKSRLINDIIIIDYNKGISEKIKLLKLVRKSSFDLFINFSPTNFSYILCFLSGSNFKSTIIYLSRYKKFFSKLLIRIFSKIYCQYFYIVDRRKLFETNENFHQTKMMLKLIEKISNKKLQEPEIEIPINFILLNKIRRMFKKNIITIHLSKRWLNKYYTIFNLIELLKKFEKKEDYIFFLTTENYNIEIFNSLIHKYYNLEIMDFENNSLIEQKLLTSNIFVLKKLNYNNWVEIIKSSKIIISPESGCTHIAAALKIPLIVIYNADNCPEYIYKEYGPWKSPHNKLIFSSNSKINKEILSLLN